MKPLWLTSIPRFGKGHRAGAIRKTANHKANRAYYSVEHPGLLIIAAWPRAALTEVESSQRRAPAPERLTWCGQ